MIDLNDCKRLRIEVLFGYCCKPEVALVLEHVNILIGLAFTYDEGDFYSELLLYISLSYIAVVVTIQMFPDFFAMMNTSKADPEYVLAVGKMNLVFQSYYWRSMFFVGLTYLAVVERNWITL